MGKFFTCFLIAGTLLFSTNFVLAQDVILTLSPSAVTVDPGDTVTISVTSQNFDGVLSFDGTLSWDETILEFLDIPAFSIGLSGLTPPDCGSALCSFNDMFVSNGDINWSWFNPTGETITDPNLVLFSIRLVAQQAGMSNVAFTDNVATTLVSQFGGPSGTIEYTPDSNISVVTVTGTPPPPPPMGDPEFAYDCTDFSTLAFYSAFDTVMTGEQVCLDIAVCDFDAITGFDYTLEFNHNVLQFDSITNLNLSELTLGAFGTTNSDMGFVNVGWFTEDSDNGVSVDDGTSIYSVCFTAIGAGGTMDSLKFTSTQVVFQASDTSLTQIPVEGGPGYVIISGNANSAVTIFGTDETVNAGGNACVDVKVKNFNEMFTADMSIQWDTAVIDFTDILDPNNHFNGNIGSSSNTMPGLVDNGVLTVGWFSNSPVTLADSSVLFQVCYSAVGEPLEVSPFAFTDSLLVREATQDDGTGNPEPVPLTTTNGSVTINAESSPEGFVFNLSDTTGCQGDTVTISLLATGFTNILNFGCQINWDTLGLKWIGIHDEILPNLFSTNTTPQFTDLGKITAVFADLSAGGVTYPDGTKLFQMDFEVVRAGEFTDTLFFSSGEGGINPTLQVGDLTGAISFSENDGYVTCALGSLGITGVVTDVDCNGESTGAIDITVTDAVGNLTYNWDGPGTFSSADEDLTGLAAGTYNVTVTDDTGPTATASFTVMETDEITATADLTNAICDGGAGGEIDMTLSGGTSGYTFAWDNSLPATEDQTDLTAGTYCVTITDSNDCTGEECFTIIENMPPTVTAAITDASCADNDGAIDLTVADGVPGYTFAWDNSLPAQEDQTGLASGTYCVTITDNASCPIDTCFTVGIEEASHTVTAAITDAACSGATDGAIDLSPSGGAGGFTFAWDNSLPAQEDQTGLGEGTYCVTITDANTCEIDTCFMVGAGMASHTVTAAITDASCGGATDGAIDLTPSGGAGGFTFAWDNSLPAQEDQTGLGEGTYCVTITDANSCEIDTCFMVGAGMASHTITAAITDVSCGGATDGAIDLTPSGGAGGFTFAWDNSLPAQEDQTGLVEGTYCVTITDANTCEIDTCFTVGAGAASHSVTASVTDASCGGAADGAIDLTPAGGAGGYTFTWDNSLPATEDQTGLTAGTYCVTIADASTCEIDTCFTVGEAIATHTVTAVLSDATCLGNDGAIDLSVSGGAGGYTFNWDNSLPAQEDQTGLDGGTYCVTVADANSCEMDTCFTIDQIIPTHTVTAVLTEASCGGGMDGAIDLTVSGGTGGYTFNWDNSLPGNEDQVGLLAGTYCVTITDANSCEIDSCFTINELNAPSVSANVTNVTCKGFSNGEIDITITGGSDPYMVDWGAQGTDPDLTGLAAGDYTVTIIDDNGCSVIGTFTVTEPEFDLTATAVASDASCNGFADGSIDLTVSGGTPDYTFSWDGGAGNDEDPISLAAGTYNVTVTDDMGCTATASATVGQPDAIIITPTVIGESGAGNSDGSISLVVDGGTPDYSFEWNPASGDVSELSDLAPGNYLVTVTDAAGCSATDSYTIDAQAPLEISNVFISDAGCGGATSGGIDITVIGGAGMYEYVWSDMAGSMTEDLNNIPSDTYSVTVTDANNNQIVGGPYVVNETSSITYTETHTDTRCFDINDGTITLDIQGGSGAYNVNWTNSLTGITLTNLAPGTYTPTIIDDEGCTRIGVGITINAPAAFDINVSSVTDNLCKNDLEGAISITVAGGTPDYEVSWGAAGTGTTVSNLAAGVYTATITDAEGCTAESVDIEVDEPSLVRGNPIVGSISCNGEEDAFINIAPTGGNGGYSFQWNYQNAQTEDLEELGPGTYLLTITDNIGCLGIIDPIVISEPDVISISADIDAASPSNDDGIINLTVTGGNDNYQYEWVGEGGPFGNTNTLFDLASGEYSVTVTDEKGCSETATILVPGSIGVNGVITDVSCFGEDDGSIIISVVGGAPQYTYQWSNLTNGQNLLNATQGDYVLTVQDANGVLSVNTFTINEPSQIQITNIDVTNESGLGCNGSVDIQVTGGTPPYSYSWSNGMTNQNPENLCKGDYTVDVIDSKGCVITSEVITIGPAEVIVTNFEVINIGCPGDNSAEVCFEIFGGCSPYSVSLDGGSSVITLDESICFDDLSAGLHTVTILDNLGATVDYTFTIDAIDPIVASTQITNNSDPANCNGAINLEVSGGTPGYTYQWSHGPTSQDVGDLCDNLSPYSVTITDSNGCTEVVSGLEVEFGISILGDVMDVCDIDNCDGAIDIEVVGGVEQYFYNWSNGPTTQDNFGICGGTYTVTVTDSEGNTQEQTFVIGSPTEAMTITDNVQNATGTNNGSIDIEVTGGYGGYTYSWSSGQMTEDIAGLVPDTYVLTVTDQNGCVLVDQFTVAGGPGSAVSFLPDNPLCNGSDDGCLEAIPSAGDAPYTYLWSNGDVTQKICGLGEGNYSVTITDANGLVLIDNASLTAPNQLLASISDEGNNTLLANVSGGTAPYGYNWNDIGASTVPQIEELLPGTYSVLVMDANGCTATDEFDLFPPGDCDDARTIISPNQDGENDNFVIVCAFELLDNELEIYDRWGRLVHQSVSYDNNWQGTDLDGVGLPEGGYYFVFRYTDPGSGQTIEKRGFITLVR